jgi:hypothetical protein
VLAHEWDHIDGQGASDESGDGEIGMLVGAVGGLMRGDGGTGEGRGM